MTPNSNQFPLNLTSSRLSSWASSGKILTESIFWALSRRCCCTGFNIYHLDMLFWRDIPQGKASLGWYAHDTCDNWWCYSDCSTSLYLWWSWIWRKYSLWNLLFIIICPIYCRIIHLPTQDRQWCSLYDYKLLLFNNWFRLHWLHYLDNNWV